MRLYRQDPSSWGKRSTKNTLSRATHVDSDCTSPSQRGWTQESLREAFCICGDLFFALELQYLPGGGIVRNAALVFVVMGVITIGAFAQLQNSSKASDESELRRIESESGKFEQQNDSKWTDLLADDWVLLGGTKVLTKSELQANVKQNFAAHNGPNPYTIEKNNLRVDLFADTAVVTYIKEYRQTADTTKVYDQDNTDVFTRSSKGWRLRLTKVSDAPAKAN